MLSRLRLVLKLVLSEVLMPSEGVGVLLILLLMTMLSILWRLLGMGMFRDFAEVMWPTLVLMVMPVLFINKLVIYGLMLMLMLMRLRWS
jgi:hypothetical protein